MSGLEIWYCEIILFWWDEISRKKMVCLDGHKFTHFHFFMQTTNLCAWSSIVTYLCVNYCGAHWINKLTGPAINWGKLAQRLIDNESPTGNWCLTNYTKTAMMTANNFYTQSFIHLLLLLSTSIFSDRGSIILLIIVLYVCLFVLFVLFCLCIILFWQYII